MAEARFRVRTAEEGLEVYLTSGPGDEAQLIHTVYWGGDHERMVDEHPYAASENEAAILDSFHSYRFDTLNPEVGKALAEIDRMNITRSHGFTGNHDDTRASHIILKCSSPGIGLGYELVAWEDIPITPKSNGFPRKEDI